MRTTFQFYAFQLNIRLQHETELLIPITGKLSKYMYTNPYTIYLDSLVINKKGFGIKNDYRVDSSQELVAIGMSNLMGSFVSSYTVTGKVSTPYSFC